MPNAIQDPLDRLSAIIDGEKSPFVELSERMKETSKDVQNLNLSILNLAIALEKRAGVKKDKEEPKVVQTRNYQDDLTDFSKGFTDVFTSPFKKMSNYFTKDSFTGKTEMPADIDTIKQANTEEQDITKNTVLQQDNTKEQDITKNTVLQQDENQNKVLADMVAVLIDMRDDKSQKQLLDETISIKKLLTDQGKKVEINKGIEPNTEDSKQEDREKLAEAIARHLGEILGGNIGNSGSIVPDVDADGKKKPGGTKPKITVPSGRIPRAGPLAAGMIGYGLYDAGRDGPIVDPDRPAEAAISTANDAGVKAIRESLLGPDTPVKEIPLKESLSPGEEITPAIEPAMSKSQTNVSTSKLKNINKDVNEQQETQKDKLKDAPWYTRMYGIGKEDYLKTLPAKKTSDQEASEWMQRQKELQKTYPNKKTSPKIDPFEPKTTETGVGKILNEANDKNTELKMFNSSSAAPQMLAPIISNKTINNTEQTMIANSPSPHSSASSFVKWQMNRSNYS
jgi:hypothetical protein